MHPLFTQPFKLLVTLGAWFLIVISYVILQKSIIGGSWVHLFILTGPPMFLLFFVLLSNYYVAKAIKVRDENLLMPVLKHLAAAGLINAFWLLITVIYSESLVFLTESNLWRELFSRSLSINTAVGLLFYFVVVLLHYLYLEFEYLHRVEQVALDNKLLAAKAELNNLKMSIHPHFLFNSFTALHTLIQTAPNKASEITLQLTNFLRRSLNYSKTDWTTVSEELDHINTYLNIEKTRLGKRLKLDFQIDESAKKKYLPPFTLLPLIENAVKHGIEQMIDGGTIQLSIIDEGHSLSINTSNPVNPDSAHKDKNGFGLQALQKRFSAAYTEKIIFNKKLTNINYALSFLLPVLHQPPV